MKKTITLHAVGSSHLNDKNFLGGCLSAGYGQKDDHFQSRIKLGTIYGIGGAKLASEFQVNKLVEKIEENLGNRNVVFLMLGTNDFSDPDLKSDEFEGLMKRAVDSLLGMANTAVYLPGLVCRSKIESGKRIDMSQATGIIQDLAKKYQKDNKPVQFLDIKDILLVPGTGDSRDGRVVNPPALKKDGIHMSKAAADLVAEKFLVQVTNTPAKKWFA